MTLSEFQNLSIKATRDNLGLDAFERTDNGVRLLKDGKDVFITATETELSRDDDWHVHRIAVGISMLRNRLGLEHPDNWKIKASVAHDPRPAN